MGVLAGTHRCALKPRVASRQSANPLWLLECGLVNVSWWSNQRDCTILLLYVCVSCLTTILDSQSLECESTYTPARRVALFSEHFVAPTASAGCVFFSTKSFVRQILINMLFISFEISSHFSCLLPAMSLSILFAPMLICFTFKRLLIIECWLELLLRRELRLRNCRTVNVSWWSNQGQRDCTVLLSTVSRV